MPKKPRSRTALVAVLAVLAGSHFVACNGASTSITGPDAVTAGGRSTLVNQRFADVEPGGQRIVDFSLPRAGALSVRVSWADETNSVDAVVTRADCADLRGTADSCRARGSSSRRQQDTERVFNYVETAGAYRLWLRNEGPGTELVLVTVELVPEVSDPVTPPAPAPPRRDPERGPRER